MIGLLGGTFDPIHHGHLRSALEVRARLRLRELRFVPLARAVHRAQPCASAEARLAMVTAAIAGQPGFAVDGREIARDEPSRTYDTLRALRAELGATEPLCLLLGGDAFNGFLDWYRPLEILELTHLAVMQRPGAPLPRDTELRVQLQRRRVLDPDELAAAPGGRIWVQAVTPLAISASAIRALIARGEDARFLLPDAVLAIIAERRLYHQNREAVGSKQTCPPLSPMEEEPSPCSLSN